MSETKPQRLDRELGELLQELRVLLPGVQVLFAFLLTLPFTVGFESITGAERLLYFGAFAATAVSTVLLVAPSVRHRARFRDRDKEALLRASNRLALVATGFLVLAMTLVSVLIGEYLYGWEVGITSGAGVAALALWCWYGWALARAARDDRR